MRIKFLAIVALQALLLCGIIAYREYWAATGDKVVLRTAPVDPRDLFRGDYVHLRYDITDMVIDSRSPKPDFLPHQPIYVQLETGDDGISRAASLSREEPAGVRFIQGRVENEYVESAWDVAVRDEAGAVHQLKPQWFQGMKKGDHATFCLDRQKTVLMYFKDDAITKQACMQNSDIIHGSIEDITEIRTKKVRVEYGIESYFVEEGKGIRIEQEVNARGPLRVEIALRKDGKGIITRLLSDRN